MRGSYWYDFPGGAWICTFVGPNSPVPDSLRASSCPVAELAELKKAGPPPQLTKVLVTSEGLPHLPHRADGRGFPHFYPVTYVLRRGDMTRKVEQARPVVLQVLLPEQFDPERWSVERPAEESSVSYRRAALARWITDPE